jgi:hypothetical protein
MQIILNSIEELKDICSLIGGTKFTPEQGQGQAEPLKIEKPKEEVKAAAEKVKKDKVVPVEDKKEEPTKVDAEVTGVDTTSNEPTKDAEVNEENSEERAPITKEMVRAICSKAIKAGKSAEVKNIVSKYGASKLPDLKEECYVDAYQDVEALL